MTFILIVYIQMSRIGHKFDSKALKCVYTHHLSAYTESQRHYQSPLFGAGPVQSVLSQNQSRQNVQPLLTVLLIRDHSFLNEDNNKS